MTLGDIQETKDNVGGGCWKEVIIKTLFQYSATVESLEQTSGKSALKASSEGGLGGSGLKMPY